jgi:hypothetical protein
MSLTEGYNLRLNRFSKEMALIPSVPSPDDFADHALQDFARRHDLPEPAVDAVKRTGSSD